MGVRVKYKKERSLLLFFHLLKWNLIYCNGFSSRKIHEPVRYSDVVQTEQVWGKLWVGGGRPNGRSRKAFCSPAKSICHLSKVNSSSSVSIFLIKRTSAKMLSHRWRCLEQDTETAWLINIYVFPCAQVIMNPLSIIFRKICSAMRYEG